MRQQLQLIMGLGTWRCLADGHLEQLFKNNPSKLRKGWEALHKKRSAGSIDEKTMAEARDLFIWKLVHRFFHVLDTMDVNNSVAVEYCQRFLELLIDVEVGFCPYVDALVVFFSFTCRLCLRRDGFSTLS